MMMEPKTLLFSLRSLSVYRALLEDSALKSLVDMLDEENGLRAAECAARYGSLLSALQESGLSLCDYIYRLVLYSDNVFTRAAALGENVAAQILDGVRHDLRALSGAAYLTPDDLRGLLRGRYPACSEAVDLLPDYAVGHERYFADEQDWATELSALYDFCSENGCGDDARYSLLLSDEEALHALLEKAGPRMRRWAVRNLPAAK